MVRDGEEETNHVGAVLTFDEGELNLRPHCNHHLSNQDLVSGIKPHFGMHGRSKESLKDNLFHFWIFHN